MQQPPLQILSGWVRRGDEELQCVNQETGWSFHKCEWNQLCHALHPLQSSSMPFPSLVPFCLYPRQSCYSHKVFQVMHTLSARYLSAALYLCCAGKRTYRPGGGPGRKDSGSGVLSRGAQGEAECHRGDAAAGISQTYVCVALREQHFAFIRAVCLSSRCCIPSWHLTKWQFSTIFAFKSLYLVMSMLFYAVGIQSCSALSLSPLNFKETRMKASGRMGGFPSKLPAAQGNCDDRQAFFSAWQPTCDSDPVISAAS